MSGKKSDDGREWTGTDLVDRHKVVLALDRIKMRGDETWYDYYHKALNAMSKLPPIDIREQLDNAYMHGATEAEAKYRAILDAAPEKRGKWIPVTNGRGGHECSLCHSYAPSYKSGDEWLTDHCPHCGADMRGDHHEG